MKILLTGCNGQVGHAITSIISNTPYQLIACDRSMMDITDATQIKYVVDQHKPDAIINAAAYTAVDLAETESELAFNVNATGPKNLAQICKKNKIPLLHLSTDYIFDGTKSEAYIEEDVACPLNVYGKSKWEGEEAIRNHCDNYFILRVSWVFGDKGNNFIKTMLRLMQEREELKVVNDQKGSPTYATDIAKVLLFLCQQTKWGTYHYSGTPVLSWFTFANLIREEALNLFPLKVKNILAITSDEYQTKAIRPKNSVLNCDKLIKTFGIQQSYWHKGLVNVINEARTCQTG